VVRGDRAGPGLRVRLVWPSRAPVLPFPPPPTRV